MNLSYALLQQMLPIWIKILQDYADSYLPLYERSLSRDKHDSARVLIANLKAYLASNDPEVKQQRQKIVMQLAMKKILRELVHIRAANTQQSSTPITPLFLARTSSLGSANMGTPYNLVVIKKSPSFKPNDPPKLGQQILDLALDEVPKVEQIRSSHNHPRLGSYDHILACLIESIRRSIYLAQCFSYGEGVIDSNGVLLHTLKYLCMLGLDHSIYNSQLTADKKARYSAGSGCDFSTDNNNDKYQLYCDRIEYTVGSLYNSVHVPQVLQETDETPWLNCDLNRYYRCDGILRVLDHLTKNPLELRSILQSEMRSIYKAFGYCEDFKKMLKIFSDYVGQHKLPVLPPSTIKRAKRRSSENGSEHGSENSSEVGAQYTEYTRLLTPPIHTPMQGGLPSPYIGPPVVSAGLSAVKLKA